MSYIPPKGPSEMWFIQHTGTPGCEHVISIDFEKQLELLPQQDHVLEPEFEMLGHYPHDQPPEPPPQSLPMARAAPPALKIVPPTPRLRVRLKTPSPKTSKTAEAHAHERRQHTIITDALILKWVEVHGSTWRELARAMGGRGANWTDDMVRNRWIRMAEAQGLHIPKKKRKSPCKPEHPVEGWKPEEDERLHNMLELYGTRWATISQEFGTCRTPQAIRNRANRLGYVYKGANSVLPGSDHDDSTEEGDDVPPCMAIHDTAELSGTASAGAHEL